MFISVFEIQVEYRSSEAGILEASVTVPGNETSSVLLENLRKFVTYEIQVLAYTRMGDGAPSQPEVSVKTLPDGKLVSDLFCRFA